MKESIGVYKEKILDAIYDLVSYIDYKDLFTAIYTILIAITMITLVLGSIPEIIGFVLELFTFKVFEGAIGIVVNLMIQLAMLAGISIFSGMILFFGTAFLCFFATIPVFLVTILLAKIYELSYDFIEEYKRKKENKKKIEETKTIEETKKEEIKPETIQEQEKENEEKQDEVEECISTISNSLGFLDEEEKNTIKEKARNILQRYYNPEEKTNNDNKEIVLVLNPNDSTKKKIIQDLIDLQKETLELVNKHKEENQAKYYYDYLSSKLDIKDVADEISFTSNSKNMSLKQTKR